MGRLRLRLGTKKTVNNILTCKINELVDYKDNGRIVIKDRTALLNIQDLCRCGKRCSFVKISVVPETMLTVRVDYSFVCEDCMVKSC